MRDDAIQYVFIYISMWYRYTLSNSTSVEEFRQRKCGLYYIGYIKTCQRSRFEWAYAYGWVQTPITLIQTIDANKLLCRCTICLSLQATYRSRNIWNVCIKRQHHVCLEHALYSLRRFDFISSSSKRITTTTDESSSPNTLPNEIDCLRWFDFNYAHYPYAFLLKYVK